MDDGVAKAFSLPSPLSLRGEPGDGAKMELGGGRRGTVGLGRGEVGKEIGLLFCFEDWNDEGREPKFDDEGEGEDGIMFP